MMRRTGARIIAGLFALVLVHAHAAEKIVLNRNGTQGQVLFDHAAHVQVAPDATSPHAATPQATCAGCHHSRDKRGVLELATCRTCHRAEGDQRNPKSLAFDEVHRERAFHDKCIGCHVAAKKGPRACVDCHATGAAK